jgi:protein-S-isoprenylcysteine O-methyltransferase Ste14
VGNRTSAFRRITAWNHIRAIALLPVMNVIVIPGTLLLGTSAYDLSWLASGSVTRILVGALALITLAAGLTLVARAVRMFVHQGAGTLAPWDPTQRLLVDDIYRYCRNPMKAGLFLILFSEAVVLRSSVLSAWAALFAIVNVVYIRLSEEPGLRARFGAEYDRYCAQVPRWWPKLRARSAPARRTVQS